MSMGGHDGQLTIGRLTIRQLINIPPEGELFVGVRTSRVDEKDMLLIDRDDIGIRLKGTESKGLYGHDQ